MRVRAPWGRLLSLSSYDEVPARLEGEPHSLPPGSTEPTILQLNPVGQLSGSRSQNPRVFLCCLSGRWDSVLSLGFFTEGNADPQFVKSTLWEHLALLSKGAILVYSEISLLNRTE